MILSDRDIKTAIKEKRITVIPTPNLSVQLGTCSLDLRLGNVFRVFDYSKYPYIDPARKDYSNEITKKVTVRKGEDFIMQPGDFALAMAFEKVTIDSTLLGRLEGRSSLARLGIVVHSTASVFDPGWDGNPVLELGNLGPKPAILYSGMPICAFTFEKIGAPVKMPYEGSRSDRYSGSKEAVASKIDQATVANKK